MTVHGWWRSGRNAAFPSGVFGPVLCCALRRLAADLRLELIFVSPTLSVSDDSKDSRLDDFGVWL